MVTANSILAMQEKVCIFAIQETVHVLSQQNNVNQTFSTKWPRQEEMQRNINIYFIF